MYNRYIPQSDGSYCRRSVQDPRKEQPQRPPPPMVDQPCQSIPQPPPPNTEAPECRRSPLAAGSFLRNILPADLDTEDLLVILLLLLMSGEGREDGNLPLLTLALYLFL